MTMQSAAHNLPSSLVDAATTGDSEKTRELRLYDGFDINHSCDSKGRNLLHIACLGGHISLVRDLVTRGADVKIHCGISTGCTEGALRHHVLASE